MPDLRVGIIGLDSSHSIEFTRRMQAPDCPPDQRAEGMQAVTCLRFETPFQDQQGLDERQAQLEAWGVSVTEDFDEAVSGCDALLMEINDPQYHLDYFVGVAGLGKPLFLDKPLADTMENGLQVALDHALRRVLRKRGCITSVAQDSHQNADNHQRGNDRSCPHQPFT